MSEKCDRGHYYVSLPAKIMLQNSPLRNPQSAPPGEQNFVTSLDDKKAIKCRFVNMAK